MVDKTNNNITMEAGVFLNETDIHLSVYMGEGSCDPVFSETISYEECIEEFFSMVVVRNTQIKDAEHEIAQKFVNKLEQMAAYARNTLTDLERI